MRSRPTNLDHHCILKCETLPVGQKLTVLACRFLPVEGIVLGLPLPSCKGWESREPKLGDFLVLSRLPICGVLVLCATLCTGCHHVMGPPGGHALHGCHGYGDCLLKEHDLCNAIDWICTGKCFSAFHCSSDCGCGVVDCGCIIEQPGEPTHAVCPTEVCALECEACGPGGCLLEHCPLKRCNLRQRCNVQPGPPPVTCQPAMPPNLLPVPTRPVFSTVPAYAASDSIPTVESHWGPELSRTGPN